MRDELVAKLNLMNPGGVLEVEVDGETFTVERSARQPEVWFVVEDDEIAGDAPTMAGELLGEVR